MDPQWLSGAPAMGVGSATPKPAPAPCLDAPWAPSCPLKSLALPAAARGLAGAEALGLGHGLWQPRVPLRRPLHTCSPCLSPRMCLTCPGKARGLSRVECPGEGKAGGAAGGRNMGCGAVCLTTGLAPCAGAWRSTGQPRRFRGPGGVRGLRPGPAPTPLPQGPVLRPPWLCPRPELLTHGFCWGHRSWRLSSGRQERGSLRPGCAEGQGSPSPLGLSGACPQSKAWAGGGVLCLGLRGWCRGADQLSRPVPSALGLRL